MFEYKERAADALVRLRFLLSGLADCPREPSSAYLDLEHMVRREAIKELEWLFRYTRIKHLGTLTRWIDSIHGARCGHVGAWTGHVADKLARGIEADVPVLHEKQGTLPIW